MKRYYVISFFLTTTFFIFAYNKNYNVEITKELYKAFTRNRANYKTVNDLLKKGANPSGIPGEIAFLSYPVRDNNREIVTLLLENGADINTVGTAGETCIFAASTPEMVNFLCEKGANLGIRNDAGATPFLAAINKGNLVVAKALLENGADINETYSSTAPLTSGFSALHSEVSTSDSSGTKWNGSFETVKFLVDHGIDLNMKVKGEIAIDLANRLKKENPDFYGDSEIILYLNCLER